MLGNLSVSVARNEEQTPPGSHAQVIYGWGYWAHVDGPIRPPTPSTPPPQPSISMMIDTGCPLPLEYHISWQSWQNPDKKWANLLTFPVLDSINYPYQTSYHRATTARDTAWWLSQSSNSNQLLLPGCRQIIFNVFMVFSLNFRLIFNFQGSFLAEFYPIFKVSICSFQPYQIRSWLDVTKMNNFADTHLHHGWRKLWNSMPLDAPRITNLYSPSPWLKKKLKVHAPRCP